MTAPLYCALVHHPVRARDGAPVTSAVTTLDVHDIARSARTYGVKRYFIVTPIDAQHVLIERILEHWRTGAGARRMPERAQALSLCAPCRTLEDAIAAVTRETGQRPRVVATAARNAGRAETGFASLQRIMSDTDTPFLLLFGTGHGLTDGVLEEADYLLAAIRGPEAYNHLSVRSAAAIILDRLCYPPSR